ncbi:MAG TPA: methyltransferase domain-containing protein [Agitococcus sp.]|nr:methyltransferase domain-containing protein [Agitococcus sp.]HNG10485.1 methyltransferase domain-containing protein [Agitococcus sp.]HNN28872.1 methyltransferase domain-containing protein [Agitococcus sp.]
MKLPHIWQPDARLDNRHQLADWFGSPLGQEVLSAQQQILSHILPDFFGYHALQLGQVVPCHLLQHSRIAHRIVADKHLATIHGLSPLLALPEQLPLATNSMDVVLIHHLLDIAKSPHAVLREACRVVIPDGYLIIVGFNPWSLWGLWRFCRLPWSNTPWLRRSLSAQRLADWLTLLDFDVVGVESAYFKPPIAQDTLRQYFQWLELVGAKYWSHGGASYLILAQKKESCMTPIRLRKPLLPLMPAPLLAEN